MEIDPRHLRILRAIAEQGSFTRAAAAQHISQPAMSAGIALLEKELGVRVLERGRHGARLNEFGQLLIRHARGLDALLDQAKAEIDLKRLGYEGPLLIGGTPVTLIELVPAAIEQLARGRGRVSITVMEGVDATLLEKLRAGEIDVMVSGVAHTAPPADVRQEVLLELPFDAVVNAKHRLAGRKVMSLRELADLQWALPTPGLATACSRSRRWSPMPAASVSCRGTPSRSKRRSAGGDSVRVRNVKLPIWRPCARFACATSHRRALR
jgi:DNA-binding transcriptional LysR family regulator